MTEAAADTTGADGTSSAVPALLASAAQAFLSLSNLCDYLTSTSVLQGGGSFEYLLMNLDTPKQDLQSDWESAVHQVAGMLLSGVEQFGDAAFDLKMRSEAFDKSDGR